MKVVSNNKFACVLSELPGRCRFLGSHVSLRRRLMLAAKCKILGLAKKPAQAWLGRVRRRGATFSCAAVCSVLIVPRRQWPADKARKPHSRKRILWNRNSPARKRRRGPECRFPRWKHSSRLQTAGGPTAILLEVCLSRWSATRIAADERRGHCCTWRTRRPNRRLRDGHPAGFASHYIERLRSQCRCGWPRR